MEEKNPKIIKKDLDYIFPAKGKPGYTSLEQSQPPQEHLLHVYMGNGRLLLPGTPEYKQYDGLETGALASCIGIALYIPQDSGAILGIGHLAPSQNAPALVEQFKEQLREAGIDLRQQRGFVELIPGQTIYDREKGYLRDKIARVGECLEEQFPNLRSFPFTKVSYSVLRGHLSSSVKLLKDGRLVILGESRAY